MKKPMQSPTARVTTLVDVTPQLLREFADRLDQAAKLALVKHGSSVIVDFVDDITFRFKPEVPLSRMMVNFVETPVSSGLSEDP